MKSLIQPKGKSQVEQHTSVTPALQRQEDDGFQASLGYIASPSLKKQTKTKRTQERKKGIHSSFPVLLLTWGSARMGFTTFAPGS
jgi:hypothetical protein